METDARDCCSKHWDIDCGKSDNPVIQLRGFIMIVCQLCGNKRCPHATDCSLECTRSNEVGQQGSAYQ